MSGGGANKGGNAQGSVFDKSAAALASAGGALGTAGNMYAAPGLTGNAATYTPSLMGGSSYDPTMVADPAKIAAGIPGYMNPYTDSVIDRASTDISRQTALANDQNAASAIGAGAFGGSRHGLVEAVTNAEGSRALGDISAQLRERGFTTAAGLSAQDIENAMRADAFNAGAANEGGRFNAGLDATREQYNANARNKAGEFGATTRNAWEIAQSEDQLRRAAGMAGVAGQGQDLGETGFDIGRAVTAGQQQAGSLQQQLLQSILGGADMQFGQYFQQPKQSLDLMLAALSGNPLNNATTTTSKYNPGMLDYASLAAQLGQSAFGAWGGK